jgi:hypothetical protein
LHHQYERLVNREDDLLHSRSTFYLGMVLASLALIALVASSSFSLSAKVFIASWTLFFAWPVAFHWALATEGTLRALRWWKSKLSEVEALVIPHGEAETRQLAKIKLRLFRPFSEAEPFRASEARNRSNARLGFAAWTVAFMLLAAWILATFEWLALWFAGTPP